MLDHLVSLEQLERLASRVVRVNQEKTVKMVNLGHPEKLEIPDHQDRWACQELMGKWVLKVVPVNKVPLANQERRVTEVQ